MELHRLARFGDGWAVAGGSAVWSVAADGTVQRLDSGGGPRHRRRRRHCNGKQLMAAELVAQEHRAVVHTALGAAHEG